MKVSVDVVWAVANIFTLADHMKSLAASGDDAQKINSIYFQYHKQQYL